MAFAHARTHKEKSFSNGVHSFSLWRTAQQKSRYNSAVTHCVLQIAPECRRHQRLWFKLALEECRHLLEGAEQPFVISLIIRTSFTSEQRNCLTPAKPMVSVFDRLNFSLSFHPGHKNAKADALSRQFAPDTDQTVHASVLPAACQVAFLSWGIEETIWQALQDEPDPGTGPPGRQYVPSAARATVIRWWSPVTLTAHTTAVIKRHFWWESLERDVQEYVAACGPCARSKTRTQRPSGLRQPLFIPSWPWSHIALDFVTRLPNSSGKTVVLSNINRFSKAAHFIALKKLPTSAENCQVDGRLRLQAPSYVRNIKCN